MLFDPENEIMKRCARGMELEAAGQIAEAQLCFREAWDISSNDFEAFTAAHYLARNQPAPEDKFYWNKVALEKALGLHNPELAGVLPSLYLNMGKSCEEMGYQQEAVQYYSLGAELAARLPPTPYGDMVKNGLQAGLQRTGGGFQHPLMEKLISNWCSRRDLRPLSMVLTAYLGVLDPEEGRGRWISSLHILSAARILGEDEQQILQELLSEFSPESSS